MASKFFINRAIEDSNAINQSPEFNLSNYFSNMFSGNQGIPAASMNVLQNMRPYFSGTNPGAYGSGDWRSNMNQLYNWGDSGRRYEYNRPYQMRDVAGEVGEYSQQPGHGIAGTQVAQKKGWNLGDFLSKLPTPMNAIRAMAGAVKDSPQEKFNREYFSTYTGGPMENRIAEHPMDSLFGNMNVSTILDQGLDVAGQKRIDRLTKAIAAMEGPGGDATKGKWSKLYQGDEEDRAEFERRLDVLRNRKIAFANQLKKYNADLVAQGIKAADTPAATASYSGPPSVAFNPEGPTQASIRRDRPDKSGRGHRGGFTDPGRRSYGPHYVQGGRVGAMGGGLMHLGRRPGYANGDMVAQETDFIEGPQGGEEFQETVVEGPEQPSREQLEALAMEIFQLPLDDLDDQQLLLVYQEAMQGQPMEEAVQEDVQFAANGGLAGLL